MVLCWRHRWPCRRWLSRRRNRIHRATPSFAFQRLEVDQTGLQPVVCLRFTGALRAEGVRYSDHLAIAPDPRPAVRVEGEALCLSGLAYELE